MTMRQVLWRRGPVARVWAGAGLALAVLMVGAAALAGGCDRGPKAQTGGAGGGTGGPAGTNQPPPAPDVYVRTVAASAAPVVYEYVGQTQASKTVEVRARVSGFIARRNFEEGGLVDEGTLLYKIDDRSFRADLQMAQAQLERGRVRLANAQRQLARIGELNKQGAASPKELDDWQTEEAQAAADVRLADAQVAQAQLNLSYTDVLSPLRGRAGLTLKNEGAYVDTGSNSLLTTVWQVDPIYVLFSIPEREWLQWKEDLASGAVRLTGAETRLQLVLLDGTTFPTEGKLDFFDATVNPQTGTATARGVFANPTLPQREGQRAAEEALKVGQFVRVRILGWERPSVLTVPQRAVIQTPTGSQVFVVGEDGKSAIRPVKTGSWVGDDWIITQGLKAGDRVIVEGFAKTPPGTPVHVAGEYAQAAPGAADSAARGTGSGNAAGTTATGNSPAKAAGSGGAGGAERQGQQGQAQGSAASPVGGSGATTGGPNGGPASGVGREPGRVAPGGGTGGGSGGGGRGAGGGG
jgi:membrane fusion protein (multidrug efflux system)